MIAEALIWIGEHPWAVFALGVAALALGVAMYCAKDFPTLPEQDEHTKSKFV
jgi:hypothetical protein